MKSEVNKTVRKSKSVPTFDVKFAKENLQKLINHVDSLVK